ncbi:MAG: 1-acyl-sn-glycerol-3-phosphate acyltransferase [Nevskiaceae bacterium]|nr:MAG: 1-acyl-sn-glycerol-3-phosphate acyltransferase [Nevskiaceae bacterium]
MLSRFLNFFYAPLAPAVFIVAAIPLCLLVIAMPTLALRRAVGRYGVRLALLCIGVPLRVRGTEHLPAGPCLVVSNHASYLDGLVLTAALPARFTFVVQDGAATWPLIGLTIRRMGVTFVNRSNAREGALQTRALIRRVQDGESLAIFAEGTFKPQSGLLPFKNGAFMIAVRAGVPVAPAAILGSRRLWGGGRRLMRWSPLTIVVRPPLSPIGPHKEAETHLRDGVRAEVLALCGEPDLARGAAAESSDGA